MLSYLVAVALLALALVPLVLGARAVVHLRVPEWSGAVAGLATATLALGAVIVTAQVLGSVGLLRRGPLTLTLAVIGLAAFALARRLAAPSPRGPPPPRTGVGWDDRVAALAAVSAVAGTWGAVTVQTVRDGIYSGDSIWYHMPFAARFVQEGSTAHLHYIGTSNVIRFYPASSELVHGVGILFLGNDLLTPVIALGWLVMALVSAWSIGQALGTTAAGSVVGLAVLLASPLIIASQPGAAQNDVAGIALLLASVAFLVSSPPTGSSSGRRGQVVAAVAVGLAVGIKLTMILPALVIFVAAVAVSPRGARLRSAATWIPILAVTGGYWYLRNWMRFGSPVPNIRLWSGDPSIDPTNRTDSLAGHLLDPQAIRRRLVPGLDQEYGSLWWLGLLLAAGGLVLAVAGRGRVRRILGLAGIAMLLAYVVSPQGLHVQGEDFAYFGINTRFALPGVALGLVLLPLAPQLASPSVHRLMLALYGMVILASSWRALPTVRRRDAVILALATFVGGGLILLVRSRRVLPGSRRVLALVTAAAVVVAVVGGFAAQQAYLDGRYARATPFMRLLGISSAASWAREIEDSRIGIVGSVLQYPYYGTDLSNHVQYVGRLGPAGAFDDLPDCASWRAEVERSDYDYLVIGRGPLGGASQQEQWTSGDPSASLVLRDDAVSVYRLDLPFAGGCP